MIQNLAHMLGGSQWLMEKRAFRAMVKRLELATPDAMQAAMKAYSERPQPAGPKMVGDVAVIDACGPITYRRSWFSYYFGAATIEEMQAQFRMALGDPAVRTIAFRWDSPGGLVDMVPEFADEVFAARGQKPIISIVDLMMASAAAWIGAQADTVYVSASSQVGSIGVYVEHEDISGMLEKLGVKVTLIQHGEHKTDGNMYEPLPADVEADIQKDIDAVGDEFDGAMARARGVTKKVVLDQFGQGKVFRGKQGIAVGLADKMGTFSQVIGKLTKGRVATIGARASIAAHVEDVKDEITAGATQMATTEAVEVMTAKPQTDMEPVDGKCEEGYEIGDDGMCHLIDDGEEAKASAVAGTEAIESQAHVDQVDQDAFEVSSK